MPRAILMPLVLALVLGAPTAVLAEPGVLRVGLPSVPATLDPAAALDGAVPLIARQVFDTVVRYAEGSSDIEPALAVQWSVSKDGLTWSFRLREGVRFHDGTALSAHHVVDSLARLIQPAHPLAPAVNAVVPRLLRGTPGVVKQIRAPDVRTVQISLVLPYAPLLTVLAHPAFSVVLPAPAGGSGAPFLGTGPFAVAEVGTGRLVLDAKAGHWAGGPRLQRVVFSEAADDGQALAALDAGSLDVLLPPGPPPRQDGAMSVPGWRIGYLALQTEKEPFSRVKARRAVGTALDPVLIGQALGRAAAPVATFLPPGVWARREAAVAMEASPERARRLFAESGARRSVSPGLLAADDSSGRVDPARVMEAVRASLAAADLAVAVQLEPLDAALTIVHSGEHAMVLWEARVDAGDPHFLLYPLSASEGAVKGAEATNLSFYRNGRLDDLLIRASQLSFRPERQRLYLRAQAMLAEELPWIPLYVRLHWAVARPGVDLRLHPSGYHRLDRVTVDAPLRLPAPGR